MSASQQYDEPAQTEKTTEPFRVPPRTWIVWIAIFGGIILLMLYKDRLESQAERITQHQFEELVDSDQIVHATINYDNQNGALNEVVGTYAKTRDGVKTEVPFHAKVRLAGGLERKLLSLPQFDVRQPNTMLTSLLVSVLPIIVIAALIWFFFIRQIKKANKGSPSVADLNARTAQQQDRLDNILDKWEEQARRMDVLLDKREREIGVKK